MYSVTDVWEPFPRISVMWVATQMRALDAEVTLEKTAVPHWVRGEKTAVLTPAATG
jgi:carboxypeptidase Q